MNKNDVKVFLERGKWFLEKEQSDYDFSDWSFQHQIESIDFIFNNLDEFDFFAISELEQLTNHRHCYPEWNHLRVNKDWGKVYVIDKDNVMRFVFIEYPNIFKHKLPQPTESWNYAFEISTPIFQPEMLPLNDFIELTKTWDIENDLFLGPYPVGEKHTRPEDSHGLYLLLYNAGESVVEVPMHEYVLSLLKIFEDPTDIQYMSTFNGTHKRYLQYWLNFNIYASEPHEARNIDFSADIYLQNIDMILMRNFNLSTHKHVEIDSE